MAEEITKARYTGNQPVDVVSLGVLTRVTPDEPEFPVDAHEAESYNGHDDFEVLGLAPAGEEPGTEGDESAGVEGDEPGTDGDEPKPKPRAKRGTTKSQEA